MSLDKKNSINNILEEKRIFPPSKKFAENSNISTQKELSSLYEFGKNIGLAFQVVDDILDFTGNDKELGKPAVSDLASGYLTAPVLYALEENKKLSLLINRELAEKDDLDNALSIIMNSKAIQSSRKLAEHFAILSKEAIVWLPDSEYKRALMALPEFVLSRIY